MGEGSYSISACGPVGGVVVDVERQEATDDGFLRTGGLEPGVHEVDALELAGFEPAAERRGDGTRVVVDRLITDAEKRILDPVPTKAKVALSLLADEEQRVIQPLGHAGFDLALGQSDDGAVVGTAETTVGGDHHERGGACVGMSAQQRMLALRATLGEIADHRRHPLGVGTRLRGAFLRLHRHVSRQ